MLLNNDDVLFIYPPPISLEIRSRFCSSYLLAGHTCEGMLGLLEDLLCPDIIIRRINICTLKDLLQTFSVTHESEVVK